MKLVHAHTLLTTDQLNALKRKAGVKTTKDALLVAVLHYLTCEKVNKSRSRKSKR